MSSDSEGDARGDDDNDDADAAKGGRAAGRRVGSGLDFFTLHRHARPRATSKKTIAELGVPSDADVTAVVAALPVKHAAEMAALLRVHQSK